MTATITPACPDCGAAMNFDETRNVLTCPQCGTRKAKRGPARQYPIKFIFQCTPEQHRQILERGGAHYLRLLVDKDGNMGYTAI